MRKIVSVIVLTLLVLLVGMGGVAASAQEGHVEQPENPDHNDEIPGCEPSDDQPRKCDPSEQGPEVPVENPRVRDHGSIVEFCWPDYVFLDVATGAGEWTLTLNDRVEQFTVTVDEVSDVTLLKARGFDVDRSEFPLTTTLVRGDGYVGVDAVIELDDLNCPDEPTEQDEVDIDIILPPADGDVEAPAAVDDEPVAVTTQDTDERVVVATPTREELPRTGTELWLLVGGLGLLALGAAVLYAGRRA